MHELAPFPIVTRIDEGHPKHPALLRRLLGRRFADLPASVRRVQGGIGTATFEGEAVARVGRSMAARGLCRVLGLPPSGPSKVRVTIAADARGETWTRRFGSSSFASQLIETSRPGVFEERLGALRFIFHLRPTPHGVVWTMLGWNVIGLPLPLRFAPKVHAKAADAGGRYRFNVAVAHPWTGLLFAYRGYLE